MTKAFVVKQIGFDDYKEWAVVSHGEAYDGKWKRRCLWVHGWYEKEDDARADAHRLEYPE